jgi:hypothetical protein
MHDSLSIYLSFYIFFSLSNTHSSSRVHYNHQVGYGTSMHDSRPYRNPHFTFRKSADGSGNGNDGGDDDEKEGGDGDGDGDGDAEIDAEAEAIKLLKAESTLYRRANCCDAMSESCNCSHVKPLCAAHECVDNSHFR